jgi:hypothetical protein
MVRESLARDRPEAVKKMATKVQALPFIETCFCRPAVGRPDIRAIVDSKDPGGPQVGLFPNDFPV